MMLGGHHDDHGIDPNEVQTTLKGVRGISNGSSSFTQSYLP